MMGTLKLSTPTPPHSDIQIGGVESFRVTPLDPNKGALNPNFLE